MKLNSYESLLSEPGTNNAVQNFERLTGPAVKISPDFIPSTFRSKGDGASMNFSRQYAHAYASRLFATRPTLIAAVTAEWKQTEIKMIADLCQSSNAVSSDQKTSKGGRGGNKKDNNSPMKRSRNSDDHEQHLAMREDIVVAVIGTVFKQQPEKPSVLQELVEDNPMVPVKIKTRYISDKDFILLEDETTRVQLVPGEFCGMTTNGLVNGIICAVRGKPTINGKFEVHDIIYATPKPSVWPVKGACDVEMVFVSGLLLGTSKKHLAYIDLLFDYLQGLSGCLEEQETSSKTKARVFILGDSFGTLDSAECTPNQDSKAEQVDRNEIAKKLDNIFNQLSQTVEVFIIPGEKDPSEPMFPQAPIHRCIFPLASRRSTFHSMCNPTRLQIPIKSSFSSDSDSKTKSSQEEPSLDLIITSGLSIKDAMRNTDIEDPMEMSQKLLEWGHLCPTAPDTIALHPGIQDDIFVLKTLPNLFVVGNQTKFGMRLWKNTKIVTVPRFADTGVAIILDKEMNMVPLNFKLT